MKIFDVTWAYFKTFVAAKNLSVQYVEGTDRYHVLAFDEYYGIQVDLMFVGEPDTEDFETNYKPSANATLGFKRDTDGAQIVNPKLASEGRRYQSMFMTFTIGLPGSMIAKNADNTDNTDFTLECFKADGTLVTSESSVEDKASIVKTRVEWNPGRSYDIQGFCIYQKTQPTTDIFLNAIAAYEIPAEYGGSIVSVRGCNLRMAPYGNREIDWVGDSASPVAFDPVNLSHEQEIMAHHGAGVTHEIMCEVIWYV